MARTTKPRRSPSRAEIRAAKNAIVPVTAAPMAVAKTGNAITDVVNWAAAQLGFIRGRVTQEPYAKGPYAKFRVRMAVQGYDPRRGPEMLRNFSRNNEWVRLAIDYRRQQIRKAKWKIVRTDDPDKPADKAVQKRVRDLFTFANPKRESFKSILDMVLDDLLVVDAGCIEKEKTRGGDIAALWSVDGSTIVPDPDWDGSNPKTPRYEQVIDGRQECLLRNDQLIYMMQTQTTYSVVGWSAVETLIRVIEADLYGERYDFDMLKQAAPGGIISLGPGLTVTEVEAFREYYEQEIAGTQNVAIFGGGEAGQGSGVTWEPFQRSNREQERSVYREWLVKKIAAIFQIDKSLFNITESVNRATSKTQQSRTDEGLESIADLVAAYITREIIWEIDPDHGFQFEDLTDRDEAKQAEIDCAYVGSGIKTINQVRDEHGWDRVPWGDNPWVPNTGPVPDEPPPEPSEEDDEDEDEPPKPGDEDEEKPGKKSRSARRVAPFVLAAARTAAQMRQQRLDYLNALESSSTTNVNV